MRKVIPVGVGVSRGQAEIAVAQADIVEKQVLAGGPVGRPAAHADAFCVSPAQVGGDDILAGVAGNLFIPDMNAGPVVSQKLIGENNIVGHRLFDKDAVPAISGGGVEEHRAVRRKGVDINPILIVARTVIVQGVNVAGNMQPDAAPAVGGNAAAIDEER